MAAPVYRGFTAPAISTGAVNSPASTQIGDLVVAIVWSQGADNTTLTHTIQSGFTQIRTHAHDDGTTDGRLSVAYRTAAAAGVASYQPYAIANATANQTSIGLLVFQGGTFDVGTLPTSNSATLTTNAVPNPPAVTGLTGDYLVLAIGAWHVTTAAATAATAPVNYAIATQNASASHVTHLAIADRALTSLSNATEDPGAFGDNVTPNGSVSMTIALAGSLGELTGSASVTLGASTLSAAGAGDVDGSSSAALGASSSTATGDVEIAGDASALLDSTIGSAAGSVDDNTGNDASLSVTLGSAASTGTGTIDITGLGSGTGDSTLTSTGTLDTAGLASVAFASVTGTAAGAGEITGTASGSTGTVGSAAGTSEIAGSVSASMSDATLSAQDEQPITAGQCNEPSPMRRRQMRSGSRRR